VPELTYDYLIFSALGLLAAVAMDRAMLRSRPKWLRLGCWVLVIGYVLLAKVVADRSGDAERDRLHAMVQGFPPTYAAELKRMGHSLVTASTPANDPIYLQIIEAQKRWLAVNLSINDVYTMRRNSDGEVLLVVDSETDYNHDGKYEGEREERTALLSTYTGKDPQLLGCFDTGQPTFTDSAYTDDWGTWMSAYCPVFDENGKMEALVGVDFDASTWVSAISRARLASLATMGLVGFTFIALSLLAHTRVAGMEKDLEHRAAEHDRQAKLKFQTLVNSVQGVVWERDLNTLAFSFVSDQVQKLFGASAAEWTESPSRWNACVHPDDMDSVMSQLREISQRGGSYAIEYRLLAHDTMHWVRDQGALIPATAESPAGLRGVITDITSRVKAQEELDNLQRQLVDASRKAGMAEVASGVLHNVGNVLNSINVSSTLIHDTIRQSKLKSLGKLAGLLNEQRPQLGYFITEDPRGKAVPGYLDQLTQHLSSEQQTLCSEVEGLVRNVEHIKDIIVMQQDYARVAGRVEPLSLRQIIEDAMEVSNASFHRHRITVKRKFADVPKVLADRHKLLQILINLIRNAKHALEEGKPHDRVLILELLMSAPDRVSLRIVDNGIGIPQDNLNRIFNHGFTTKEQGHGFGLHASAIAAHEMGGSLTAFSEGPSHGATFVLEIPAQVVETGPSRHAPALLA
jgi:PAS domain S-box-containing protein